MKVLIIGGFSGIGSKIVKLMMKKKYDVFATFLPHETPPDNCKTDLLDITDKTKTMELLKKVRPDIVVHTAAVPSMDECETDKEKAWKVNVEGTRNIVDGCKAVNAKIAYISTSAVFDGRKNLYHEDDQTNPVNNYGRTKLEGEKIVSNSGLPFLIARIDHPYGWVNKEQKQNTVTKTIADLTAGKIHNGVIDWYNTPTFLDNCAEVIASLLEKNKNGIYHAVGSDYINRYDFALKIAEVFALDKNLIKPKSSKDFTLPAKRGNCHLSNKKAEKESGVKFVGIEEGLKIMQKQKEKDSKP